MKTSLPNCKIVFTVCDITSHALLQDDLNRISVWASTWQLKLNEKKCILLKLKSHLVLPSYVLNDILLSMPDHVKDLGVYITPKLDFTYHCNHIANIAFKRCYLLLNAFVTRDHDFLSRMYVSYVRPLLEFSSQFGHLIFYQILTKSNQYNAILPSRSLD